VRRAIRGFDKGRFFGAEEEQTLPGFAIKCAPARVTTQKGQATARPTRSFQEDEQALLHSLGDFQSPRPLVNHCWHRFSPEINLKGFDEIRDVKMQLMRRTTLFVCKAAHQSKPVSGNRHLFPGQSTPYPFGCDAHRAKAAARGPRGLSCQGRRSRSSLAGEQELAGPSTSLSAEGPVRRARFCTSAMALGSALCITPGTALPGKHATCLCSLVCLNQTLATRQSCRSPA